MKTLIAVVAVLFSVSVAQAQHGYGYPAWQTPNPYQYNYYQPYYPQWGGVYSNRFGNMETFTGTGAFQGLNGTTMRYGNQTYTNFNYNPIIQPRFRYGYGW